MGSGHNNPLWQQLPWLPEVAPLYELALVETPTLKQGQILSSKPPHGFEKDWQSGSWNSLEQRSRSSQALQLVPFLPAPSSRGSEDLQEKKPLCPKTRRNESNEGTDLTWFPTAALTFELWATSHNFPYEAYLGFALVHLDWFLSLAIKSLS